MDNPRNNPKIMLNNSVSAGSSVKPKPMQNTKVPANKPVAQPTMTGQTKR